MRLAEAERWGRESREHRAESCKFAAKLGQAAAVLSLTTAL